MGKLRGVSKLSRISGSTVKKEGDLYLALLAYRSTPLEIGYSPTELFEQEITYYSITPDFSIVAARDKRLEING